MTTRQLSISTLSPVHIGCDDVYEPGNFIIADGLLHGLDPADLAAAPTDAERSQLAKSADDPRDPIGALQRFFRKEAERFAALSTHQVGVADDVATAYEQTFGRATQQGAGGRPIYNNFQINRTAYRALDNAPYLPGSSLKGSIRTAWLNHINAKRPLTDGEQARIERAKAEKTQRERRGERVGDVVGQALKQIAAGLQPRLLGYAAHDFHNDPFRQVALADAHAEAEDAPPTRVLYAVSKKKRVPRPDERPPQELKVFLETVPEALPAAFSGELRLNGDKIDWASLCQACNGFYQPQLEAELDHAVFGNLLDGEWKRLIGGLLRDELNELIAARQGFLLRVGRHSGAEAVTVAGTRHIKIIGPEVDRKKTFDYRPETTEKRFASATGAGADGLLPFGWIWADACDDAHRHLSDALRQKLAARSRPLRDAHRERLLRREDQQRQRAEAAAEVRRQQQAADEAARAEAQAEAARQAALQAMPPNLRRMEDFKAEFAAKAESLRGRPENPNGVFHGKARELARDAAGWPAQERLAAAQAIEEWLPRVVRVDMKDERKKLKLAALKETP